jgi:uncharacterized membrane protein YeaQ/YmgE (transglycosylase-associated protein family)
MVIADINFNDLNLFNACIYWAGAGLIAGSIAQFVVRGKLGCVFGNLLLGLVGAMVGTFIINIVLQGKNFGVNFIEITLIASVMATLIAFIFHQARRAEGRYQERLLDKYREP